MQTHYHWTVHLKPLWGVSPDQCRIEFDSPALIIAPFNGAVGPIFDTEGRGRLFPLDSILSIEVIPLQAS